MPATGDNLGPATGDDLSSVTRDDLSSATPDALDRATPDGEHRPETRVKPFAMPSATLLSFWVLLSGLCTAGAFAGAWLHLTATRQNWSTALADASGETVETLANLEAARGVAMMLGTLTAIVGGTLTMFLAPKVIERRRGLRPLPGRYDSVRERIEELAREAGLRRPPRMLTTIGNRVSQPFVYGRPGVSCLALPYKLIVEFGHGDDQVEFDVRIRHELAHLRNHDVTPSTLAVATGYLVAALLAVPVLAAGFVGDHSLIPDYLWRAGVLFLVVGLARRALLRFREHDADLGAARSVPGAAWTGAAETRLAETRRVVAAAQSIHKRRWRPAFWQTHPDPEHRVLVLDHPERSTTMPGHGGFAAAFFVGVGVPLIHDLLVSVLLSDPKISVAWVVTMFFAGTLLAGSIGLGLWQAASAYRIAGGDPPVTPILCGVGLGYPAGQATSLGQTGLGGLGGGLGGTSSFWGLVASAGTIVLATLLVLCLAEDWATVLPRLTRPAAYWFPGLLLSTVGFTVVLWLGAVTWQVVDVGGWYLLRRWLWSGFPTWPFLVTVSVLFCGALLPHLVGFRRPPAVGFRRPSAVGFRRPLALVGFSRLIGWTTISLVALSVVLLSKDAHVFPPGQDPVRGSVPVTCSDWQNASTEDRSVVAAEFLNASWAQDGGAGAPPASARALLRDAITNTCSEPGREQLTVAYVAAMVIVLNPSEFAPPR